MHLRGPVSWGGWGGGLPCRLSTFQNAFQVCDTNSKCLDRCNCHCQLVPHSVLSQICLRCCRYFFASGSLARIYPGRALINSVRDSRKCILCQSEKKQYGCNSVINDLLSVSLVDALQCNSCFYDTSQNGTVCKATITNCTTPEEKFCTTMMEERQDGSKTFTRTCVPSEVCQPDYCEKVIVEAVGRKSCNITCCEEDLCNRDDYTPPINGSHVSHAHWFLCYACFIAVAWMSLSGGRVWH